MGGERKSNASTQTVWDNNRRDNPYQFFLDDLLCDVTLTVSSGDDSHISMRNKVPDDESIYTKGNISPIDSFSTKFVPEKRSFKAHRLILACHSEYFHRMFVSCGMREVSGEVGNDSEKMFDKIRTKINSPFIAYNMSSSLHIIFWIGTFGLDRS